MTKWPRFLLIYGLLGFTISLPAMSRKEGRHELAAAAATAAEEASPVAAALQRDRLRSEIIALERNRLALQRTLRLAVQAAVGTSRVAVAVQTEEPVHTAAAAAAQSERTCCVCYDGVNAERGDLVAFPCSNIHPDVFVHYNCLKGWQGDKNCFYCHKPMQFFPVQPQDTELHPEAAAAVAPYLGELGGLIWQHRRKIVFNVLALRLIYPILPKTASWSETFGHLAISSVLASFVTIYERRNQAFGRAWNANRMRAVRCAIVSGIVFSWYSNFRAGICPNIQRRLLQRIGFNICKNDFYSFVKVLLNM